MTDPPDPSPVQPAEVQQTDRRVVGMLLWALAAVLIVFAVQTLIVKPYRIPSESMTPTLQVGQRILVDRVSEHLGAVHRGSVIVFHPPLDVGDGLCGDPQQGANSQMPCGLTVSARPADETFIKRVVGLPGDRIALHDGHLIRNGQPIEESYIRACPGGDSCTMRDAVTVPSGSVYVMGDNRGSSNDSRFWGPVPDAWIVGIARASYWPPGRVGGI